MMTHLFFPAMHNEPNCLFLKMAGDLPNAKILNCSRNGKRQKYGNTDASELRDLL